MNCGIGATPPLIEPADFRSWILFEDDRLLVVDKPGVIVCHPSKQGPRSSLAGAAREYLGRPQVHFVFRLDRETSGVIVLAKDGRVAGRLQKAMQRRLIGKTYLAILEGVLREAAMVDQPLGPDPQSCVTVRSRVVAGGSPGARAALTRFEPVAAGGGYTLVRVWTGTGRKHQIRIHAHWLGHAVAGDKLYGPDENLYLDFARRGWTERHAALLPLPRQALHCAEVDLRAAGEPHLFRAPLPPDLQEFCRRRLGLEPPAMEAAIRCVGLSAPPSGDSDPERPSPTRG